MIDAPAWCANAWVACGAFRNLGYPADELFFGCIDVIGAGQCIVMQLQRKGKAFTYTLDRVPGLAPEIAEAKWKEFAKYMNEATDAERRAVWDSSEIVLGGGPAYLLLAKALVEKGLDVPKLPQAGVLWGMPTEAS